MALCKTLARRFSNAAKLSSAKPPPPSSVASILQRLIPGSGAHEPGLLRRFLQRRPLFQSAAPPPARLALPVGDDLADRIREMNATRIRLDGLLPPPRPPTGMRTEEARKVVRAARMEVARARLRETGRSCVSYAEFVRVCREVAGGMEEGVGIGTALDESGVVIVLGDTVFVRPEMLTKAIESMIPPSMSPQGDPRREELKKMEAKKAAIDAKAEALVRKELWGGLAFLVLQTAGFMRLTFWELSWDVMEPICFFVTSLYFMAGYAFFLRTSRDPSFEGFFQSRLDAKRWRLMKARNFDVGRFNELRRDGGFSLSRPSEELSSSSSSCSLHCHCHGRRDTLFGSVH
ncbi:calcium uniporter protein 2, mitochondrial-like [Canna indica]|uniref:Calcium uniporter protein 2, mitochondrial-like n=1 Tax=Canna indica TaxID=4628 RepID=A0AAQ3QQJ9_9LILI|nr:calcium uniporter protein 2, mitochondrial-like [Canna indica]